MAINVKEDVVAEQIESAIKDFTYVRRDMGTTVTCKAAPASMSDEEVVDNLLAVANSIAMLTGIGWSNIKVIYARTRHSPSLPLFVADSPEEVPTALGETEAKAKFDRLQARGEELAKGEDKDEAEDFKNLRKALGDDEFMRIMRGMAQEEEYVKEHPEVLTRPKRRRIRVVSDSEDSEEEGEENEVGEVFQERKDIVSATSEPPAKKPKTSEEEDEEEAEIVPDEPDDDEEEEEEDEEEEEKGVPAPTKTPKKDTKSRPTTPFSSMKTRAASRKQADEMKALASKFAESAAAKKKQEEAKPKTPTKTPTKTPAKKKGKK